MTAKTTPPAFLTTTLTTTLHNPGTNDFDRIDEIGFCNEGTVPATLTINYGASAGNAAGTRLEFTRTLVPGQVYQRVFGGDGLAMKNANFLTGGASVASTISFYLNYRREAIT